VAFDRALALDVNNPALWYSKGLTLETLQRTTEAKKCYDKARSLGYQF